MHFLVYVLGEDPEGQMEPFGCENQEHREFQADGTEEVLEAWENRMVRVRLEDGPDGLKVLYHGSDPDVHTVEVSVQRCFRDIEHFAQDWYGYAKEGDEYGYYSNPNSFWDWYEVGGRWANDFVSVDGDPCSQCKLKDIDIEATWQQTLEYITAHWPTSYHNPGNTLEEKLRAERSENFLIPCYLLNEGAFYSKDEFSNTAEWAEFVAKEMKEAGGDCLITIVDAHN